MADNHEKQVVREEKCVEKHKNAWSAQPSSGQSAQQTERPAGRTATARRCRTELLLEASTASCGSHVLSRNMGKVLLFGSFLGGHQCWKVNGKILHRFHVHSKWESFPGRTYALIHLEYRIGCA